MDKEVSPTTSDLDAIEAEWPVIEAELDVVEAECRLAVSRDDLAIRAHRRAVAALALATRTATVSPSRIAIRRLAVARTPFLAVVPTTPAAA